MSARTSDANPGTRGSQVHESRSTMPRSGLAGLISNYGSGAVAPKRKLPSHPRLSEVPKHSVGEATRWVTHRLIVAGTCMSMVWCEASRPIGLQPSNISLGLMSCPFRYAVIPSTYKALRDP